MRCSVCEGHTLQPHLLEEGLVGAGCANCSGILLSLINYRFWVDNLCNEGPLSIEALSKQRDESAQDIEPVADSLSVRSCPKCTRLMTKYAISAKTENRIDVCLGCDEVWLDQNEWALLKQFNIADQLATISTGAWQRQVRLDREAEHLKHHYEKVLGEEDFKKLAAFKIWLDNHPDKSTIQHYLTIKF